MMSLNCNSSSSVSDIRDYIKYIIIFPETLTSDPPIYVYINRINNRLVFKIKDGYKLELQMTETMKLFGSIKYFIDKVKNGENVLSLEVVCIVLVQCNLVDNEYQQKSEVYIYLHPINLMIIS